MMRRHETPESLMAERRWPELSETEERLYHIAVPEHKDRALKIETFINPYDPNVVAKDNAYVERLEREFELENAKNPEAKALRQRGELFEAIVADQIDSSNWLGEHAEVIVPSRYDDIANGIDAVVEFKEGPRKSHLALAVDITKSPEQIEEKISRIKESIEKGELSYVKYFKSEDFQGELKQLPRVVVGADQKTMEDVSDLLLRFKIRKQHPALKKDSHIDEVSVKEMQDEFKAVREKLANHPLQFQILSEIQTQLNEFAAYADSIDKKNIAKIYRRMFKTIQGIFDERTQGKDLPAIQEAITGDSVHQAIIERAKRINRHKNDTELS